jgi:hypothetical protein
MADLRRNNASPWLERELTRQLAPVTAPESLWDRINQKRRHPEPRVSLEWIFWPIAAAMVLLVFAGVARDRERAVRSDFRSDNFDDTRAWVKSAANIDIDVPAGRPAPADRSAVRLLGARLIQFNGLPVAAIDYRVGDQIATLFVSGKDAGLSGNMEASKYLFSQGEPAKATRLFSWNMRDQTYTLASSGAKDSREACLLCHATTPG